MLPEIFELSDKHNIPTTFFEYTTTLAFMKFIQSNVDVVVLETGLGGRLDATNVVSNPALSIITSIQRDHMSTLGDTREEIAREKCGIIKSDSVYGVLMGPGVPQEIVEVWVI